MTRFLPASATDPRWKLVSRQVRVLKLTSKSVAVSIRPRRRGGGWARIVRLAEASAPSDRQAVIAIAGVTLVLSARRRPYHDIADFTALGLDPVAAGIVVVKSGYLSPELAPIANPALMMLSEGVVDQFVERLPRLRKVRPTFPFDTNVTWTPDARYSSRSRL